MPDQNAPSPAPVTPAPAAANIVVTPQPIAPKTAIEQASDAARARIAQGVGLAPADAPAAPAAPAQPHHAATQNRRPDGRFSEDAFREVGANVPADDEQGAPQVGHEAVTDDQQPEAPEGQEGQQEPVAGAEGEEEQGAPEGEGGEEVDEEALTVALPGRRPDDEPYEIVADSPESAERLRQLANAAMRGEEAREYVAREMQQVEQLRDAITIDPAGFLLHEFGQSPEIVEHVALALLSRPEVWERVGERVLQWDDPNRFELDAAKIGKQQYEVRDQLKAAANTRAAAQQNFRDIQQAVTAMMPAEMSEEQQAAFYRDALRDLKEHADRYELLTLPVADIPLLLAQRLAAYNINPLEAAHRAARGTTRSPAPSSGNPAPSPAPTRASTPAAPKARTGKEFVASAKRRARAASVAPAGAGAPSNAPTPPPGQTIEQRIAWHKQQAAQRRAQR